MKNLLNKKNVVAVGEGYKESKGFFKKVRNTILRLLKIKSILVFVDVKRPDYNISPQDLIPDEIDGQLTDVIEIGEILPMYKRKHRPIRGGVSACGYKGTACTSGIKVYRDRPYALMNWHCVYGKDGDVGDSVVQPSRVDGGKETDVMGYASDFIPLEKGICDSALVELKENMTDLIYGLGDYEKQTKEPFVGQILQKFGRTSGHTRGKVIAVNVTAQVNYPQKDGSKKTFIFKDQVFTDNKDGFIEGGDSSSIAFENRTPVGQIFAASPVVGVITPLSTVLKELDVSLEEEVEGYVALERDWLTDKKTLVRLNLRSEPRIGNNIIKTLSVGTGIKIIEYSGYSNNFHWLKIKV